MGLSTLALEQGDMICVLLGLMCHPDSKTSRLSIQELAKEGILILKYINNSLDMNAIERT
jgi:hypothetical protein